VSKMPSLETPAREIDVYAARVRDARLLAGFRSSESADRLGVSRVWYSRLETSGEVARVEIEFLTRLAVLYGFDAAFFSNAPSSNAVSNGLHFRAQRSMTKFDEETIEVWSRVASELIEAASEHINPIPVQLPVFTIDQGPEQAADEVRRLFGIDVDEPVAHVIRALERAGVPVFCAPFDTRGTARHDAVSLWTGARFDRPIVLLRQIGSWERIRMSAAHELGHLIQHRWNVPETAEEEAFAFGSAFLMPARAFRRDWPARSTLVNLMPLKRKWGVSLSALVERAYRLGLIGADIRTGLYKQLSARRNPDTGVTWRVEEPGSSEREPESPWLVGKMLESAYGPKVSIEDLRRVMGEWPSQFVTPLVEGQRKPKQRLLRNAPLESVGLDTARTNVTPLFGRQDAAGV
jgi:Zn-dependent peptidase ImmA (M78 family)/transcriptional regulator with XRE-family HTH domain